MVETMKIYNKNKVENDVDNSRKGKEAAVNGNDNTGYKAGCFITCEETDKIGIFSV